MFALVCFKWSGGLHYEGFLCMMKMNRYLMLKDHDNSIREIALKERSCVGGRF